MASPAAHPLNTAFLQWVSTQLQDDPAANLATGAADYLAYVDEYKRRSGATGNGSPGQAGTTSQRLLLPSTGPGFVFTLPKDVAGVPGPHDGGGDDDEGGGDGGQQRHHEREFGSAAAEPPAPKNVTPRSAAKRHSVVQSVVSFAPPGLPSKMQQVVPPSSPVV